MVVANLPQLVSDTWVKVSWDEFSYGSCCLFC